MTEYFMCFQPTFIHCVPLCRLSYTRLPRSGSCNGTKYKTRERESERRRLRAFVVVVWSIFFFFSPFFFPRVLTWLHQKHPTGRGPCCPRGALMPLPQFPLLLKPVLPSFLLIHDRLVTETMSLCEKKTSI